MTLKYPVTPVKLCMHLTMYYVLRSAVPRLALANMGVSLRVHGPRLRKSHISEPPWPYTLPMSIHSLTLLMILESSRWKSYELRCNIKAKSIEPT